MSYGLSVSSTTVAEIAEMPIVGWFCENSSVCLRPILWSMTTLASFRGTGEYCFLFVAKGDDEKKGLSLSFGLHLLRTVMLVVHDLDGNLVHSKDQ